MISSPTIIILILQGCFMKKEIFQCPVCKGTLSKDNNTYKCQSNHSFDIAKEGYVNLLISGKGSSNSGDDKQMVASRTQFLDKGFYSPLRDKICDIIKSFGFSEISMLDSGCGEGYYTSEYTKLCQKCIGIDISKNAVKSASKRCREAEFAVASVYHLPIMEDSIDVIVNCFSPNACDEFSRVLKSGGYLVYVVPGAEHLWELKSILYDNPYENEEKTEEYDGFELFNTYKVSTRFSLSGRDEIMSLYHMTPYTWTTPKDGSERLDRCEELTVGAEFIIYVYKKN